MWHNRTMRTIALSWEHNRGSLTANHVKWWIRVVESEQEFAIREMIRTLFSKPSSTDRKETSQFCNRTPIALIKDDKYLPWPIGARLQASALVGYSVPDSMELGRTHDQAHDPVAFKERDGPATELRPCKCWLTCQNLSIGLWSTEKMGKIGHATRMTGISDFPRIERMTGLSLDWAQISLQDV